MKLNDIQRATVYAVIKPLIEWDKNHGKNIEYDQIQSYIDRGVQNLHAEIDSEDNAKLFSEIECEFRITHTAGSCIFDDYEDRYDWYSNDNVVNKYYWTRYRQHLMTKIDVNSINLLDNKTLPDIMNCLGNPNDDFEGKRLRRGLIIGDVQSGKTATYIGLICKAADAGYKVVILLAGITENLRCQTQERIDEGIVGRTQKKINNATVSEFVGVGRNNHEIKATSFTSCASDFVGNSDKIAASLNSQNSLVLFVIKKNVSILRRLYNWLRELNLDPVKGYVDAPMLLIDDEADNASVNTRKDETDPTQTNRLIRDVCNLFKNATYVGFTATPFANVFIDPDSVDSMKRADLFPEHFIYALPTPSNYIGAKRIFYASGDCYKNLRYISDIEEPDYASDEYKQAVKEDIESLNEGTFYYLHKKEWMGILPDSLRAAIISFFIGNAVRDLRGYRSAPRSMLVNMSRFVKVQRYIAEKISEMKTAILNRIRYDFSDNHEKNKTLDIYTEFKSIWDKHYTSITDITFERVMEKSTLISAIEDIKVMTINGSKSSNQLDYRVDKSLRVIAVGGIALSRGLTLEGLLISYFYRNTATFDVLMQMGRWFGYRYSYEDLFQVWTSQISADWYAEISRASDELKSDIQRMFDQQLTPKDFGLKVRDNCEELRITAANKMRSAVNLEMKYSFYGGFFETPYISLNTSQNKANWNAVKSFTAKLFNGQYHFRYADIGANDDANITRHNGASRFFEDVPKDAIIDFLATVRCSLVNTFFNVENLLSFLKSAETKGIDLWDVVFVGGESGVFYDIPGLENIECPERTIYISPKRAVQITSRRRLLSASAGRLALSPSAIKSAEDAQRKLWIEEGCTPEEAKRRSIPLRTYFSMLKERKPLVYIVLVQPRPAESDPNKQGEKLMNKFRVALGDDKIVAFGIGIPAIAEREKSCRFKVNKTYYRLNMLDEIEEEEEDEE